MNEPPSYPEPVERFLWAALLVDRIVDIPCDLAIGPSWPCHGSTEWRDVCPDLPVPYGPVDLSAHSAKHGSASVSCRGTAAAIRDLMVYGGGYVAACSEHDDWLEHHRWADSMTAGSLLWRSGSGTWDVVGWTKVADEIAQWRRWLSGRVVDPGDRRAVASLSRSVASAMHSRDWGYQMAQIAERLTNRP